MEGFKNNKKMLGVIGGMGPLASKLFYEMIIEKTDAKCDQDNIDMLILSDASMPDRTGAILSGDTEAVRDRMLRDANILKNAGCSAVAVTCNTAHYFVDMIEDEAGIPFIHMIRETAKELQRRFEGKKIAILASDGTIKTELYQKEMKKYGVEPYAPSEETQKKVMHTIYGLIKQNKPADWKIWDSIEINCLDGGCDGAVLACTELSVVRKELSLSNSFYVDPMDVLADRCLEFCRG